MKYNFQSNTILTSQNPGAFLTFQYDGSEYNIEPSIGVDNPNIYINGWDVSTLYDVSVSRLILTQDISLAAFHIFTDSLEDFNYPLSFIVRDSGDTFVESIDVSVLNRPYIIDNNDFNTFSTGKELLDDEASYLLLRTNPKYSGNIKLCINSSDNMFLDTFKVSDILSNKKYRKQKVSGNSFLSGDIRRVFESLPIGEVFKVDDENTLDISTPKTDYYEQFNTTYSYGSRILVDELYPEEYSILAPLWINSQIPDYFTVFRLDGVYNEETYTGSDIDLLADKYITDGDLIKSWNLKENTEIGNYFNNHLNELLNYDAPVNLSLNENDPNTWTGVAIDKGIITGRSEVPYFFEQTIDNFTDLNAFVSQGFERNNLLCPNLINVEYLFNDTDVSLYTMNRYFGLYLSENELYKFFYYKDVSTDDLSIVSLDGKDVSLFMDSSIFDSSTGDVSTGYANRLLVRNDGDKLNRISNITDIDSSISGIEDYTNKLGKNIFNALAEKKDINTFLTLKINNILYQGEHLRIIDNTNFRIWEIYSTESDMFEAGEAGPYVTHIDPSAGYPNLYRTAFSVKGEISDQITAIKAAFDLFEGYNENHPFSTKDINSNSLSLMINDEDNTNEYLFQRLTSNISYPLGNNTGTFSGKAKSEDISFYNKFIPDSSDFTRINADASFGPIDLEIYGDRQSLIFELINPDNNLTYSIHGSLNDLFTEHVLYKSTDNYNRLLENIDISVGEATYQYNRVEDPLKLNDLIVLASDEINLDNNGNWWAYDVYPISVSLMGINPVKDFDFTVYDSSTSGMNFKSKYWDNRGGDNSTYILEIPAGSLHNISERNSFLISEGTGTISINGINETYDATINPFPFNTFFGEADFITNNKTIISYNNLDGSYDYTSYDSNISEENIDDYYAENFYEVDNSLYLTKTSLKYGLTVPTISKWSSLGKDVRGNEPRLLLNSNFFSSDNNSVYSNFLVSPDVSLFNSEMSYPIFKYLGEGGDSWEDYIYYDINDVVEYEGERITIRNMMDEYPHLDIFSKLLYNSNNVNKKTNRSSICYYSLYKNQVVGLVKGLNIGIEVTPIGEKVFNIVQWNRFKISFVTSPSRNLSSNNPMEVIINENAKTILIIWYQGNDVLHYNKRYSDYTPGKNNLVDGSVGLKEFSSFVTNDDNYVSYVKSPFFLRNKNNTVNIYDNSTGYGVEISSPYVQFNYNRLNGVNSIFNAYSTDNFVSNSLFESNNKNFNTFSQKEVIYAGLFADNTFGRSISNIGYNYYTQDNYYKNITCDLDILTSIISNNNIDYTVLRDNQKYTSGLFGSQPLELTIYEPVNYVNVDSSTSLAVHNGGYKPIFKDLLNFAGNDDPDLISITEKGFVSGNTNLISYNNIDQYWYNNVVDEVRETDSSNNISFWENRNPFKALWDFGYFNLKSESTSTLVNGYNSTLEIPSFFGSKTISLPPVLELNSWNGTDAIVVSKEENYVLEYNITKAILDLFISESTFTNNWAELTGATDEVINKYIIKTILNAYNISINKIITSINAKPLDGDVLAFNNDGTFTEEIKNIPSSLSLINNEYIYKITVPISDNKSYYTSFKFTKK